MSEYTYKIIVSKSKTIKKNVETEYKLGVTTKWSYYIAKAIIKPNKNVKKITFDKAPSPKGTSISRQISKKWYMNLAKNLVKYVEKNKRLPNYLTYGGYQITPRLYTYMFARVLVFYDKNGRMASQVNVNSKAFTKPSLNPSSSPKIKSNAVYDYFVKKTGKKFTTIDDLLTYVKNNYHYEYYYDDHKNNQQVMDSKGGNCTDLLQWLINMVEPMGYEWKCIHVKCRSSGGGHVRGQFKHKKHTEGNWINRDPASVANGNSIKSIWCSDGILQAKNPSWFLENLRR